jgi:hypothetical protein
MLIEQTCLVVLLTRTTFTHQKFGEHRYANHFWIVD